MNHLIDDEYQLTVELLNTAIAHCILIDNAIKRYNKLGVIDKLHRVEFLLALTDLRIQLKKSIATHENTIRALDNGR